MKGLIRSCIVPHIVLVFICTSCTALPAVVLDGNLDDLRKRTEIRDRRGGLRHLFENYSPHDNALLLEDPMESKVDRPSPHRVVTVHMFNFTDLVSSPLFMSPHLSFRRTTAHSSQELNQEFSKTLQDRSRSKRQVAGQEQSVCDEIQEYTFFRESLKVRDYQHHLVTVLPYFRTPDLNEGEYIQQYFVETKCNHRSETSKGCRGIDKTQWNSSCVAKKSNVPAIVEWNGKLNYTFIALRTSCNCALKKKPKTENLCESFMKLWKEQEKAEGEGQGRGEVGEGAVDNVDDNNGRKSETSTASGSAEDAEDRRGERRRHPRPTSKESRKSRRRRRRRRQRSRERRTRSRQDNPPTDLSSPNKRTKRPRHGSN